MCSSKRSGAASECAFANGDEKLLFKRTPMATWAALSLDDRPSFDKLAPCADASQAFPSGSHVAFLGQHRSTQRRLPSA